MQSPYDKILISPIKNLLDKIQKDRGEYVRSKADLEVYTGIYLVIGIFFGMSTFIGIMLYWQVLRVRTMINDQTRLAFVRFDEVIRLSVLSRLPAVFSKPYNFIKDIMVSMGSLP